MIRGCVRGLWSGMRGEVLGASGGKSEGGNKYGEGSGTAEDGDEE